MSLDSGRQLVAERSRGHVMNVLPNRRIDQPLSLCLSTRERSGNFILEKCIKCIIVVLYHNIIVYHNNL